MKDLYDHEVDVGLTKMWENQTFLLRNSSDSLTASVTLDSQRSYETITCYHLTKEESGYTGSGNLISRNPLGSSSTGCKPTWALSALVPAFPPSLLQSFRPVALKATESSCPDQEAPVKPLSLQLTQGSRDAHWQY